MSGHRYFEIIQPPMNAWTIANTSTYNTTFMHVKATFIFHGLLDFSFSLRNSNTIIIYTAEK